MELQSRALDSHEVLNNLHGFIVQVVISALYLPTVNSAALTTNCVPYPMGMNFTILVTQNPHTHNMFGAHLTPNTPVDHRWGIYCSRTRKSTQLWSGYEFALCKSRNVHQISSEDVKYTSLVFRIAQLYTELRPILLGYYVVNLLLGSSPNLGEVSKQFLLTQLLTERTLRVFV